MTKLHKLIPLLALLLLLFAPTTVAAKKRTTETFCKLIPATSPLAVHSQTSTIATCNLPCFNFNPGNQNTLITFEGSNEIAFTYSPTAPPSQIDVTLLVACDGSSTPALDTHTYTILNGSPQGATLTAIGGVVGVSQTTFNPLKPSNPWCRAPTNGCNIELQMDALTPGDVGIDIITNPPGAAHSDTAVLVKGVPLTN